MKKKIIYFIALIAVTVVAGTSCQKGDLLSNPNATKQTDIVPVTLILNRITYGIYAGGGVVDNRPGNVSESPWDNEFKWSQYYVSNYAYYRGTNAYNWSNSATAYDMLKNTIQMEQQTTSQFATNPTNNVYYALAKFFRAYSFIWTAQRVGDIPMTEAGDPTIVTPKYNTQKDVFKNSLALLDSANTLLYNLINVSNAFTVSGGNKLDANGDVFGLTVLQWEKVINTYKLRVLISLSKRADDNADLNIKQQFAAILADPVHYPIMTGNGDNMSFKFNTAYNPYPIFARGNNPYNNYANIGKTYLDLTTASQDPRTFIAATPAPAQATLPIVQLTTAGTVATVTTRPKNPFYVGMPLNIIGNKPAGYNVTGALVGSVLNDSMFTYTVPAGLSADTTFGTAGKVVGDFTAYIGADINTDLATLFNNGSSAASSIYSYANFNRYYSDKGGANAEPAIVIGYPELCFNIAEGINRGWAPGNAGTWYLNGINASLAVYGLAQNQVYTVGDLSGKTLGTTSIDINTFLTNVAYQGGAAGLTQILQQKYIALFNNSGWEAFYNWRRTGVPAFSQGGAGIGNPGNVIPRRWQYPQDELSYNTANVNQAISSQFGGTDDLNKDTWLTK